MDTPEAEPKKAFSVRYIFSRALAALLVLVFVLVVSGYYYLASPRGTARISAILSASLHLPVTISRIGLSGDILVIQGVNVGNPQGFSDKTLVSIDAVRVAPDWRRLLTGQRALRLVAVDGAMLDIRKGGAGDWNVSELRKRFAGGEGGAELFIGELKVTRGDILVNGKGLRGVSLTLRDLATKGSAASGIRLAVADEAGNRYVLNGRFRPGAHPEADLELAAPSIAFGEAAGPAGPGAVRLSGGSGSLLLRGGLRNGIVRTTLEATVNRAAIRVREREIPLLSGRLGGSATYDLKADSVALEDLSLAVKEMLDIRATGRASNLKSGARYDLLVAINSLDLGKASTLVPAVATSGTKLGGKVTSDGVKVAGGVNGGLSEVTGKVSLQGLSLARGKILLVDGVGTDMTLATVNGRVEARGELVQEGGAARPLLERINAPYALAFSGRLKPESMELTGFTARLMGTPLNGSAWLRPGAREPFSLQLRVPEKSLEAGSFGDLSLDSGAVVASLELHGTGPRDFRGALDASLGGIEGKVKGERLTVGSSKLTAAFGRNRGQYSVSGDVALGRGSFRGTDAAGRFGFKVSDGLLRIENGTVTVGGAAITVPELVAAIPQRAAGLAKGFPVDLSLSGGAVRRGELDLAGISGSLAGNYAAVDGTRRFDGAGAVAVKSVLWRGREIGGQKAELAVTRSGVNARLGGPVLGGSLDGSLSFDPFAAARGVAFDLSLKGVELAKLSWLFERKGRASLSGGELSLSSRGDYSARDGVRCRIGGDGEGIAVADGRGKAVLSGATLHFDGSLAQGKMLLPEALLRIGEGAAVSMKGEIGNVLSTRREGSLAVDLPATRLDRIIDPFANALPRLLQEASVAGDVAAHALLTVRDGRGRVEGFVQLDDAGIDAESQKLKVEGISGKVPFSVGFPAAGKTVPGRRAEWQREEYDQRLEQLKDRPASGSLLTIGRLGFGPVELKETSLRLTAAEGIVEAVRFSSKLTTGAILGQGYLALSGGGYGGDFVLNDLSLQQVCALFPKIKGYVSGRLDGLARVEGRGGGVGPSGSLYLWAREGDGEKMLVSRAFLQKLAGKNLQGFFFRDDRPFDTGEVRASLEGGYLTFDILDISHTNIFGVRDLKVSVTDTQNRIALDHLMDSIRQAAGRAKKEPGPGETGEPAATPEFKWDE